MPNSEFSWGENDIEYDDKFHIIRHNNSYEKWDFKYDGESGLMTEIIHSIFDENMSIILPIIMINMEIGHK